MQLPDLPYELVDDIISKMRRMELQDVLQEMLRYHKNTRREYHEQQMVPRRRYGWYETFEWSYNQVIWWKTEKKGVVYNCFVEDLHEDNMFSNVTELRNTIKKNFPGYKHELKNIGMPTLSLMVKHELIQALYKLP
jgi:hypothetical protein